MDVLLQPCNLATVLKKVQSETGMLWNPLNPLVAAAIQDAINEAVSEGRANVAVSDITLFEFNEALRVRLVELSDPSQARARSQFQTRTQRAERRGPEKIPDRALRTRQFKRTDEFVNRSAALLASTIHSQKS